MLHATASTVTDTTCHNVSRHLCQTYTTASATTDSARMPRRQLTPMPHACHCVSCRRCHTYVTASAATDASTIGSTIGTLIGAWDSISIESTGGLSLCAGDDHGLWQWNMLENCQYLRSRCSNAPARALSMHVVLFLQYALNYLPIPSIVTRESTLTTGHFLFKKKLDSSRVVKRCTRFWTQVHILRFCSHLLWIIFHISF